jgi:hypothetical protein
VYEVEAIVKVSRWIVVSVLAVGGAAAAESGATWWVVDSAPAIVHIDEDIAWDSDAAIFGEFECCVHCVSHPYLADSNHQRKSDGPAVAGRVVSLVRKATHNEQWHHSGITQHHQNCPHAFNKDNFEVVTTMQGKKKKRLAYDLKICEALEIRRNNCGPGKGLNEDMGANVKSDMWDPVLNNITQ